MLGAGIFPEIRFGKAAALWWARRGAVFEVMCAPIQAKHTEARGIVGILAGSMRVNCQVLCVIAALTCAIAPQPPTSDFCLEENVAFPMRVVVLLRSVFLRLVGEG